LYKAYPVTSRWLSALETVCFIAPAWPESHLASVGLPLPRTGAGIVAQGGLIVKGVFLLFSFSSRKQEGSKKEASENVGDRRALLVSLGCNRAR